MRRKVVVTLAALLLVAGVSAAAVVKTTTKAPTSFTTSTGFSSIGAAFAFQGPGAIAGTTAGAFSVTSGSLTKSAEGSTKVSYDSSTGGNHYRLVTTVIVGISFSYAKKISILWWTNGTMSSSNSLTYIVTKDDDGDVQVVMSGTTSTSAITGVNSSQFKPLFKFYGALVNFSNHASLETWVSSTSTITATPVSTGLANGQIAGFVFGIP